MKKQNRVAFFNILSVVLLNGISIITGPLFSRMLETSGYGSLKIINIQVGIMAILFTLQTQGTLANARVEYPEEEQKAYQSAAMGLSVFAFACFSAVVLVFMEPISRLLQHQPVIIYLMLLQAFGTFAVSFLNTKFVYEFKAGRNLLTSLGVTLVTFVLSIVLILQMPPEIRYYGRVIAIAATYGIIGVPACIYILAKGKTFFHRGYWKFCLALAIPSVFNQLSDAVLGQSDQLMLERMINETEVGIYSLAWTFGNIMYVIFGALNKTWCPFFFEEMKEGKRDAMLAKTRNFLELFTVLSVGFILLSTEVYHIYADKDYWAGTMAVPVFVACYYLNFLSNFPINYEYYHKKTKAVALVTLLAAIVNITLNFFLIRRMGMMGAAVATAISRGFQLLLHYGYARFILGKEGYPFGIGLWWKPAVCFALVLGLAFAAADLALLRWGLGAAIGIWELLRIRRRKVLI